MPLLDLKTDLKSLKYGSDRPGGGNSGQPYIQNNINNPTNTVGNIDDGLIRGGLVGATRASSTDNIRIGKFFKDLPKGRLFVSKQVGLQLSNPRLETKKGIIGVADILSGDFGSITKGLLQPTRIYNLGINTLAQVPVNAFGVHFNRHGLLPVQDESTKYLAVAQANNKKTEFVGAGLPTKSNNRLVQKAIELLPQQNNVSNSFVGSLLRNTGSRIPFLSLFFKPSQQVIDQYVGGPGSVYGVGRTFIRRYDYTVPQDPESKGLIERHPRQEKGLINYINILGVSKNYFKDNLEINEYNSLDSNRPTKKPSIIGATTYATTNISDIALTVTNGVIGRGASEVQVLPLAQTPSYSKYRQIIESKKLREQTFTLDGNQVNAYGIYEGSSFEPTSTAFPVYSNNKEVVRINIPWNKVNREIRVGSGRVDNINLTPIFELNSSPGNFVTIRGKQYDTKDLIKFRIGAVNTSTPELTNWMVFRAYLTGFQDSFNPEWSDIKYVGRGEKFKLYNGFDRSISFSFKVAALSAQEMEPMYQKLNYLASNTMPEYVDTVMRGPFMKFTVGDYINAQPGVITSLQYSITDDTPWEIAITNDTGITMYELPHIINVNLSFFPIGVKDGGLPEKKVSTPIVLQNNSEIVNGQTNPWLKSKNVATNQVQETDLYAYRFDGFPPAEIVERTRPESFINQTVTPRVPIKPVDLTRSV